MSKVENITATSGKGDDAKTFNQDFELPENINEGITMFGEEEVFSLFMQQKVIRLQAQLRNPGTRKTTSTYEVFKKCIDRNMDEEDARQISSYTGPADGSTEDVAEKAA